MTSVPSFDCDEMLLLVTRVRMAVCELVDQGHTRPSMTQIARRARTEIDALRFRWRSSAAAVIEVLDLDAEEGGYDVLVTGDFHRDLDETARQLERYLQTRRGLCFMTTVMSSVANPFEKFGVDHEVISRRLDRIQELLDASGEEHLSVRDIVDGLIAPLYFRSTLMLLREGDGAAHVAKLLRLAEVRAVDGVGGAR